MAFFTENVSYLHWESNHLDTFNGAYRNSSISLISYWSSQLNHSFAMEGSMQVHLFSGTGVESNF